MINLSWWW